MEILTLQQINQLRDIQLTEEEILLLKLNQSMSYEKIGEHLGYTKQNVFHIIKRAKGKIKQQRVVDGTIK